MRTLYNTFQGTLARLHRAVNNIFFLRMPPISKYFLNNVLYRKESIQYSLMSFSSKEINVMKDIRLYKFCRSNTKQSVDKSWLKITHNTLRSS